MQLRVYHIPQLPGPAFYVNVCSVDEAKFIITTLACYDLFQFKNKIKPDYCNASGLEVCQTGSTEWNEWHNDNDEDIDDIMRLDVEMIHNV